MSLHLSQINTLCMLRLSAIGDVCHAVAMVQAIQREAPHIEITWVIGKVEYQLLKHLPQINFVIFDKSQGKQSYRQLRRTLVAQLQGQKFDVLLHMQVALRATAASLMIPAKVRLGFDRFRAKEGQFLVTNQHIEPQREPHVLDGFMGFAKAIGVQNLTPSWDIPVPEADTAYAQAQINQPTFIICAAASKAERNWLPERYAAVADYAMKQGLQVILCGGPTALERDLAADIIAHSQIAHSQHQLINLVGQTSLTQLLALLKQAKVVLAPDTGPAHMAVTQGTPVIGLYAHSNPGRTGPYLSRELVVSVYEQVILEQVEKAQSMADIPWGKRAKGMELMQRIEISDVIARLDTVLHRSHDL